MAWIRCCGGTKKPTKSYLYNAGSWSVPYNNPSPYTWYGNTPVGFSSQIDKMVAATTNNIKMLGTGNTINLTDFKSVHIKAKMTAGYSALHISSNKNENGEVAFLNMTDVGVEKEYVLDISLLSGYYYLMLTVGANAGMELYEMWLED